MTSFLLCVALFGGPQGEIPLARTCNTVPSAYYASTLAYLIAHEDEFDAIVTFDDVIQIEYCK